MIRFGIIGGGWRSEFYVRIANALSEVFEISGIYLRNAQTRENFAKKYTVKIFENLDGLLATNPDFVVSCVNKEGMLSQIERLCNIGVAVLSETPAGTDLQEIKNFKKKIKPEWKVQIAEQFHLQPRNQAIKSVIKSGVLGEINHVHLSAAHDYHAVSLIRFFLKLSDEIPKISSVTLPDKVTRYNGRNGITEPCVIDSKQKIAVLNYKEKTAVYDFNIEQYFSDIRQNQIIIRGTKGEIVNDTCTYLDGSTPIKFNLSRNMSGTNENLDGMYLSSITGNGKILFENPFKPARLTDEEIAIAQCLVKMSEYLKTGKEFYSLRSAMTDAQTALNF